MRKSILKKISAVACAMVLTVASTSNVFANNWESGTKVLTVRHRTLQTQASQLSMR